MEESLGEGRFQHRSVAGQNAEILWETLLCAFNAESTDTVMYPL